VSGGGGVFSCSTGVCLLAGRCLNFAVSRCIFVSLLLVVLPAVFRNMFGGRTHLLLAVVV